MYRFGHSEWSGGADSVLIFVDFITDESHSIESRKTTQLILTKETEGVAEGLSSTTPRFFVSLDHFDGMLFKQVIQPKV